MSVYFFAKIYMEDTWYVYDKEKSNYEIGYLRYHIFHICFMDIYDMYGA